MNALFVLLMLASLAMAVVLLLSVSPKRRAAFRRPGARRALAFGQLGVGALWIAWGVAYLAIHGARGWYPVLLGAAWCWQAARRLVR